MTIRHSSANIRAMTFRMLFPFSAALLAVSSALASTGQNQAPLMPAELSEPEFQSLVAKTNMYVKALNAVGSAQQSYDRYDSWVDVKKGPTGKERYISYGLYEINHYSVDEVKAAAKKGPS
ncbi:MAG: YiiG family protein, partial [Verrucomicrobiota bacterium]|nr:YiiG family protein [Verrucomicrobiota bacterium]